MTDDRMLSHIHQDLIHEVGHLVRLAPLENLSPPMAVAVEQVAAAADELGCAVWLLSQLGDGDLLGRVDAYRAHLEWTTGQSLDRQTAVCRLVDAALCGLGAALNHGDTEDTES